jgi:hypothetical protein
MKLTLTSDQYDDTLALGGSQITTGLLDIAHYVIQRGGRVIVQTEFINAPPNIRRVFSSVQDLREWQAEIARVTERAQQQRPAEPGAAPNGGPATPVGNSGVTEGPAPVS